MAMKKSVKLFVLMTLWAMPVVSFASVKAVEMKASDELFFGFDKQKTGNMADGWANVLGKWVVKMDGRNKVLAQTAENTGNEFNVAVYDGASLKDVELSVDIRAISGNEDQGGGLVWRYIDAGNYYIVRFNPLEDNFRFYKVFNGRRIQLASADATVPEGSWFNLTVVMKGSEVSCSLNGKELINFSDETFPAAGKTGFWTKADAVSDFDNFSLKGQ
jgi:hypothetical protein